MTTLRHRLLDAQGQPIAGREAYVTLYHRPTDPNRPVTYQRKPRVQAISGDDGWLTWDLPPIEPGSSTFLVTGVEADAIIIRVSFGTDLVTVNKAMIGVLPLLGDPVDPGRDLVTEDELSERLVRYVAELGEGATGPQGPQGEVGPEGPQGPQGETGPEGPQGDTGPEGPRGNIGATGATGSQGIQGVKGDTGSQGPQGVPGTAGSTGATGAQGPKGDTGNTGAQGIQGATGAAGSIGPTGSTGPAGPGFTARGAWATATVYAVNDIVTANGSTFRVKTAHTSSGSAPTATTPGTNYEVWAAQGAQGIQGTTGATGSQGTTGATGATGPTGDTGPTGPGFTFRGAWATGTAYAVRDVVTSTGSTFVVTTAHTSSGSAPNASVPGANYSLWAQKGDTGAQGVQGVSGTTRLQRTVVPATTTTYTPAPTDENMVWEFSAACLVTLPSDASVPFPVGGWFDVSTSVNAVTVVAGSGATTITPDGNSANSRTTRAPFARLRCHKVAANTWDVVGDSLSLVDTGSTQILSGKTLTSPSFAGTSPTGLDLGGVLTTAGFAVGRYRGTGTTLPTTNLLPGDFYHHQLLSSRLTGTDQGPSGFHGPTELVWTGAHWRQRSVCLVENAADRAAMTTAYLATGQYMRSAAGQAVATQFIHDGFEVMETAGNRRYYWQGSGWVPNHLYPGSTTYTDTALMTAGTGWSMSSINLRYLGGGMAYASAAVTKITSTLAVAAGSGDIGNVVIASLAASATAQAFLPLVGVQASSAAGGRVATGYLNAGGDFGLSALAGDGTAVAVNDTIQLATVYRVADIVACDALG